MKENVLIMKIRDNYKYFGGLSLIYGLIFTFCLYKNISGITFPVCVGVTIAFRGIFYEEDQLQAYEAFCSISGRNGITGIVFCNHYFIFCSFF